LEYNCLVDASDELDAVVVVKFTSRVSNSDDERLLGNVWCWCCRSGRWHWSGTCGGILQVGDIQRQLPQPGPRHCHEDGAIRPHALWKVHVSIMRRTVLTEQASVVSWHRRRPKV